MKLKTTKKNIQNGFNKIIRVGYCDLQSLLDFESPFAYSAGYYGWACDYYNINGVCISTGYSPIGESIDYNLIKEYESKARKIRYHRTYKFDTKRQKLGALLHDFISKATA